MNIAVIGAGYVGQVVSACLTTQEHNVTIYDIDHNKLRSLQQATPTIHEEGLKPILEKAVKNGTYTTQKDLEKVVKDAEVLFLCVGTPSNKDGSVNLTYHFTAVEELKPYVTQNQTIIIKSTVPSGTAKQTKKRLTTNNEHPAVLSNPEFLKEGTAVDDFLNPDRIVVGGQNQKHTRKIANNVYGSIAQETTVFITDNASAELAKYAANSFLATKISFINEIARLCEKVGANVDDVAKGMSLDNRIQDAFFGAGVGYGGSCFPKDVKGLVKTAKSHGEDMKIIQAANTVNNEQRTRVIDWVDSLIEIQDSTIGVWGLAFKPGTDDVRESPALTIINELLQRHAHIKAYDPQATQNSKQIINQDNLTYTENKEDMLEEIDILLVLTDWEEFKTYNIKTLDIPVYDGRNIYKEGAKHIGR